MSIISLSYRIEDIVEFLPVEGRHHPHAGLLEVGQALEIAGQVPPHLVDAARLALVLQRQGQVAARQGHFLRHRQGRHGLAVVQVMAEATDSNILTTGGQQSDDYENLLLAARKAVEFGYRVYLLPNPTETRTPDFILEKKGVYRMYDLKTVFGKSSIGGSLLDSIGQCNCILIHMTVEYNTRKLAQSIKRYFEINDKATEVLIFKGRKRIPVKRSLVVKPEFFSMFKRAYER